MRSRAKSFTLAAAAIFAVLLFGGSASKADARENGPRVTSGARRGGYGYSRQFRRVGPYRGRFDNRVYAAPYRTVRVFVAFPFPHWVLQRVYTDATVVLGPGCNPY